ncbi:hypothetical protein [uncultured Cocleimonas sp.]|uniref:hypothetical protein n=1 Tax=uncultured Cocleimonas sp. TaxID=1051587 RepID=UPI00262BE3C4|nr:hypothetical protein [uncultured Cocleimonas sp.]
MKKKPIKRLSIHKNILLILGIFFAFTGLGKIWLWTKDEGNDVGLYLGIVFCILSLANFIFFKLLKK